MKLVTILWIVMMILVASAVHADFDPDNPEQVRKARVLIDEIIKEAKFLGAEEKLNTLNALDGLLTEIEGRHGVDFTMQKIKIKAAAPEIYLSRQAQPEEELLDKAKEELRWFRGKMGVNVVVQSKPYLRMDVGRVVVDGRVWEVPMPATGFGLEVAVTPFDNSQNITNEIIADWSYSNHIGQTTWIATHTKPTTNSDPYKLVYTLQGTPNANDETTVTLTVTDSNRLGDRQIAEITWHIKFIGESNNVDALLVKGNAALDALDLDKAKEIEEQVFVAMLTDRDTPLTFKAPFDSDTTRQTTYHAFKDKLIRTLYEQGKYKAAQRDSGNVLAIKTYLETTHGHYCVAPKFCEGYVGDLEQLGASKGMVHGTVFGDPIAKLIVKIGSRSLSTPVDIRVKVDRTYAKNDLDAGDYNLTIKDTTDYYGITKDVHVDAGSVNEVNFELVWKGTNADGVITVEVKDKRTITPVNQEGDFVPNTVKVKIEPVGSHTNPIEANAQVTFDQLSYPHDATKSGTYTISTVDASTAGLRDKSVEVEISGNTKTQSVVLILEPVTENKGYLEFIVTDSITGDKLDAVEIKEGNAILATKDTFLEYYSKPLDPGSKTVTIHKDGYQDQTLQFDVTAGEHGQYEINLQKMSDLTGTILVKVTNEDGAITVNRDHYTVKLYAGETEVTGITTLKYQKGYKITDIPLPATGDVTYEVRVTKDASSPDFNTEYGISVDKGSQQVTLSGTTPAKVEIALAGSGDSYIYGVVKLGTTPVGGKSIVTDPSTTTTTSGEDGRYTIRGVNPGGTYTVKLELTGTEFSESVTVTVPDTGPVQAPDLIIREVGIGTAVQISGLLTIQNEVYTLVPGDVTFTIQPLAGSKIPVTVGEDGHYTKELTTRGQHTFLITAEGMRQLSQTIEITNEAQYGRNFELIPDESATTAINEREEVARKLKIKELTQEVTELYAIADELLRKVDGLDSDKNANELTKIYNVLKKVVDLSNAIKNAQENIDTERINNFITETKDLQEEITRLKDTIP